MNYEYWFSLLAIVVLVVGIAVFIYLRVRRAKAGPQEAIAEVGVSILRDVLIPDGMGGQIYVDRLVLTNRGLAVLDIKDFAGAVFASDRMQEWTVIGSGRRFGFPNPQGTLLDRVAAVRQLVSSIPVEGHIVFSSSADFSKGRPKHVLLANELERHFTRPTATDRERLADAYAPHWAKIKAASEPADTAAAKSPRK